MIFHSYVSLPEGKTTIEWGYTGWGPQDSVQLPFFRGLTMVYGRYTVTILVGGFKGFLFSIIYGNVIIPNGLSYFAEG